MHKLMTIRMCAALAVPMLMALLAGAALAEDAPKKITKPTPYPLNVCVVSSETLGAMGDAVEFVFEGRAIKVCCADCQPTFEKDPAKYLALVDAGIVAQQKPHYPLKTCLVSKEPLGDEAVDVVIDNRLVRLCCADCVAQVKAEPAKYLKALDAAIIAAGEKAYPLKTCPVSGQELGTMGEPKPVVVAGRMLKVCCPGCTKKLLNDPAKYLKQLDDAESAQNPPAPESAKH